jgi:hypothetical protein
MLDQEPQGMFFEWVNQLLLSGPGGSMGSNIFLFFYSMKNQQNFE